MQMCMNKKLSCRRKTARHFLSWNILLSHSRSLKVIRNDTAEYGVCKSLLVFHWNYVCISYCFWDIHRQNGVTLKPGVRVVQGQWRGYIYTTFCWSAIVSIAVCCTYHFRVISRWIMVTLKSRLEVTEGHSNWYHSKAWMLFSIRLL